MRATAVLVLLLTATGAAGCGAAPSDPVRAKVEQFAADARQHDYAAICDQVLATALLERLAAAGISCPGALSVALNGVSQPVLSIGKIRVQGTRAAVVALSAAAGQRAALTQIDLAREGGGWRITSLGSGASLLR
jgi:hypothetical protein